MVLPRKYPCKNCGEHFEAYPPDDIHTLAMVLKCSVCFNNNFSIPEIPHECDNCGERTIIYWHKPVEHSIVDIKLARLYRKEKLLSKELDDLLNPRKE